MTAIREFEKAVQLKPDDADAHYNLAILYDEKLRDNDKALEHYRAYLKIAPNSKDSQKVSKWIIDKESENKVRD
jgi:Flp pilus assembly protein TadD